MDISMDIHGKSVDIGMDVNGKFYIHGKPVSNPLSYSVLKFITKSRFRLAYGH